MKIKVVFNIWGKKSETVDDFSSIESAVSWCQTINDNGYAYPLSIVDTETRLVIMDETQLFEHIKDR